MHKICILFLTLLLCCCKQRTLEKDKLRIIDLQKKERITTIDSSLFYLQQSQDLIDAYDNIPDTLIIENIFRKGYYFKQINELDSASYYFHRALDLIKTPFNSKRIRIYFQNAWETDESLNNRTNAIGAAQKFIDISKHEDNIGDLVFGYNAMERFYLDLGNYKTSLQYNILGSEAALEVENIDMYVITGNARANLFYLYLGEKQKAFKLLDTLKSIKCLVDPKRQLLRTYGTLNYYEGEYRKAIKDYKQVIALSKIVEPEDLNYNLLESYNNIVEAYIEIEDYPIAKKYLDSSKAIINESSYKEYVQFYNELLFRYNYKTHKDEHALMDEYYALIEDNNRQYERKINEKLTALELSNEQEQLAVFQKNEAETKTFKFIALSSILAALILFGYLIYRQRRLNFERENMQIQQRLLRSQMNPHFIFNTLSVIQNQIKENKAGAAKYLLKFSKLLRLILENSLNDYVHVENELDSLRKYLDLQLVRFPDKFEYTIDLENFQEDEMLYIPPMLIQPFVENSIEHGFIGVKNKGKIDIKMTLQDKMISCVIEDNGKGLKNSNMRLKTSVSINLISKFIQKVTNQKLNIRDKKSVNSQTSGVIVDFLIPFKFSSND